MAAYSPTDEGFHRSDWSIATTSFCPAVEGYQVYPVMVSDLFIGVAFHGIELTGEQLRPVFQRLLDWQTKTGGVSPSHGGATGPGYSDKVIKFKTLDARLKKTGFERISGLEMYTLPAEGDSPVWQHSVQSHVSGTFREIIFSASSSLTSLGLDGPIFQITQALLKLVAPRYGYAFPRDRSLSGSYGGTALSYGGGIPVGTIMRSKEERDEALFLQEWRLHVEKLRLYDQGILRDLYPWNFLNEAQLARKVGRKLLRNWIAADPSRGELIDTDGPLQLWTLTESQIAEVRPVLWDAGILFNWRDYNS